MLNLTIAATVIAIVPLLLGIFLMKEFNLSDRQNDVDKSKLNGRTSEVNSEVDSVEGMDQDYDDGKKGVGAQAA